MISMFSGKFTYFIGGCLICFGVYQIATGDTTKGVETILGGLAACGLRRGIATDTTKVTTDAATIATKLADDCQEKK